MMKRLFVAVAASLGALSGCGTSSEQYVDDEEQADAATVPEADAGAEGPAVPPPPGGGRPDGGTASPPPLGAPVNEWTWFDIPGTMCGNGEQTGLAVNWGTGTDVLIVHDGGGACWDEASCTALPKLGASSEYINQGYTRATFEKAFADPGIVPKGLGGAALSRGGLFDRTAANNPFRDSSYVFVPYCTGDLSGGDATQQFLFPKRTMHFHGQKNIEAYLPYLTQSFTKASGVTLAGRSAGGFSAAITFWRFQDAFGPTIVNLIDDSGPSFDQPTIPLLPQWKAAWNFDGALPPECAECKTNIRLIGPYYARKYPKSRLAFLSYDNDPLIAAFFMQPPPLFMMNLRNFTSGTLRPLPNFKYFIVPGFSHTMVHDLSTKSGALPIFFGGPRPVELGEWLTRMKDGASSWNNTTNLL